MTTTPSAEIAVLHERLMKNADYKALIALVDARIEAVHALIERDGVSFDQFQSLAAELRGLRAARGASTVTRGRKS